MPDPRDLPQRGTWEVGFQETPEIEVERGDILGVLVVVERGGLIRHAAPVAALADIPAQVEQATRESLLADEAMRPAVIACRPDLRFSLSDIARKLGADLVVKDDLPEADEVMAETMDFLAQGAPLLPTHPEPWSHVVGDLVEESPWEWLGDDVEFHFRAPGTPLHGAVALVLGMAGEQHGVVVYPSEADRLRFAGQALGGFHDPEQLDAWCAHLDPPDELPRAHQEILRALDLVHDDLVLQLFHLRAGEVESMPAELESAVLSAIEGVLAACEVHDADVADSPTATRLQTAVGEVEVHTLPALGAPLLLDVAHQVFFSTAVLDGEELPGLALKMAKRDAERLYRILEDIGLDEISIRRTSLEVEIVARSGGVPVGLLARIPSDESLWEAWRSHGRGAVVVSAGGARRPRMRSRDVVAALHVDFLDPAAVQRDTYQRGALDGASWDGPMSTWPKASTVLLDYAAPLQVELVPADAAEQALTIAATVWSTVVQADIGGDPTNLEATRAQVSIVPELRDLVELLVERKRALYPQDTRLMMVDSVSRSRGRLDLQVKWTPVTPPPTTEI